MRLGPWRWSKAWHLAVLLVALPGLSLAQSAWAGLELVPHHVVRAPMARLHAQLRDRFDDEVDRNGTDAAELRDLTLRTTSESLRFGLDHQTTFRFAVGEREGNCVEYAHLFAMLFNRGARRRGLRAKAWVVRSQAHFLGVQLSMPAFADHDWVIIEGEGDQRWFVDPTLHDAGLGWDVASSVTGRVTTPRR